MKTIYEERYQSWVQTLITARKTAGLTQAQVAEQLGKPQSYIAKIERCERKLDVMEFVLLCETLGVSVEQVLT